jgi:hypothetical protein
MAGTCDCSMTAKYLIITQDAEDAVGQDWPARVPVLRFAKKAGERSWV